MTIRLPGSAMMATLTLMVMGFCSSSTFAQAQYWQGVSKKSTKEDRRLNFLYGLSKDYLAAGTGLDMTTTVQILNHPTMASRPDGTILERYYGVETGWAGCLGRRNTFAAVGANMVLNAGVELLSRNLYRRGGHWRTLAIAVNVLKGTDNALAGIHNVRYRSDIDRQIRAASGGYTGAIVWSH